MSELYKIEDEEVSKSNKIIDMKEILGPVQALSLISYLPNSTFTMLLLYDIVRKCETSHLVRMLLRLLHFIDCDKESHMVPL